MQALGNHEFDDGIPNLVHFLENVTFPVLAANIDDSHEPTMQGKYGRSVVLNKGGRRIGIVGYLTTETLVSWTALLYAAIYILIKCIET